MTWKAERGPWLSIPASSSPATACILLFVFFLSLSAPFAQAIIQLDNSCPWGDKYIQFVGFPCLPEEERLRDPDGAWSPFWVYYNSDIKGLSVANYQMNRLGIHLGNETYCANFTLVNGGCDGNATVGSYSRTIAAEWADKGDFFFAPYSSALALPILSEISPRGKIIFASISSVTTLWKCNQVDMDAGMQPECSKAGEKRFAHAFTMEIPGEEQLNPTATMYKLAGAKTVMFWSESSPYPSSVRFGIIPYLQYSGLQIIHNETTQYLPTQDQLNQLAARAKELNPDGIIAATSASTCHLWFKALRALNYMPKAMTISNCVSDPATKYNTPDAVFSMDKSEFDPRMTGISWSDDLWYPRCGNMSSAQAIWNDLIDRFNTSTPHWSMPLIAGAGLVLHKVIERAGCLNTKDILRELAQFNEPTFAGQIGFSNWGQVNTKDVIMLQADQNFNLQIVYPLGSASANLLYPAPTFDEREFHPKYLSEPSEQVLAALTLFCILLSLVLLIGVIVLRKDKVVIAASPLFLATLLIGSILLYSTYFAWVLRAYTPLCYLRYWLLGMGFVTMFGALFAKTWRIMRIFTTTELTVFHVSNLQLLLILFVLLGIEAVFLGVWSGTSRPHQVETTPDPLRPALDKLICSRGKSDVPLLAILVAYKFVILLYGIYMSIRIWKIPLKFFNESRSIAFSMYNMLCFGILAFGLQLGGAIPDPAMFVVRSICLLISTFLTVAAICGPKIYHILSGHSGLSNDSNPGTHSPNGGSLRSVPMGSSAEPREEASLMALGGISREHYIERTKYEELERRHRKLKRKYFTLKDLLNIDEPDSPANPDGYLNKEEASR